LSGLTADGPIQVDERESASLAARPDVRSKPHMIQRGFAGAVPPDADVVAVVDAVVR
jgi:hypothetical protein